MSVEELCTVHPEDAVAAAQYERSDMDAVAELLSYGYTVWGSKQEVIDNYLDDCKMPQDVRMCIDEKKLWRKIKLWREFVGTPSGKLVEFYKGAQNGQ